MGLGGGGVEVGGCGGGVGDCGGVGVVGGVWVSLTEGEGDQVYGLREVLGLGLRLVTRGSFNECEARCCRL